MRVVCDLLVVSEAEMISLLAEFPTLPDFFDFFLALETSDDIFA
jgi:hypothetical protein